MKTAALLTRLLAEMAEEHESMENESNYVKRQLVEAQDKLRKATEELEKVKTRLARYEH